MVEFLLLVLPIAALASGTISVTWYAFAKAEVFQIASEAAFQFAEPDSTEAEVNDDVACKLSKKFGDVVFVSSEYSSGGLSVVNLSVSPPASLGVLGYVFPEVSVTASAPNEI